MTLGQEFGTKKAKKVIADQTVNAINQRKPGETAPPVDAAQQAVLDELNVKTEGMMTAEETQREADKSKPRPTPNPEATTPADVYPIERLVSQDDLALIKVLDWQNATKKGEAVTLKMRYTARRLRKLATAKDATSLKLLKYINIMLTWYNALESGRGMKKIPRREVIAEKVDAPGAILSSLVKNYSDGKYVLMLPSTSHSKQVKLTCEMQNHVQMAQRPALHLHLRTSTTHRQLRSRHE